MFVLVTCNPTKALQASVGFVVYEHILPNLLIINTIPTSQHQKPELKND
jgi:hypothetical protein